MEGNIMRNGKRDEAAGFPSQVFDGWFPSGVLRRIALEGKSPLETYQDVEARLLKTLYIAQANPWPSTKAWYREMQPIFNIACHIFKDKHGELHKCWFAELNPDVVSPVMCPRKVLKTESRS